VNSEFIFSSRRKCRFVIVSEEIAGAQIQMIDERRVDEWFVNSQFPFSHLDKYFSR